jgi:hypothetical protein
MVTMTFLAAADTTNVRYLDAARGPTRGSALRIGRRFRDLPDTRVAPDGGLLIRDEDHAA